MLAAPCRRRALLCCLALCSFAYDIVAEDGLGLGIIPGPIDDSLFPDIWAGSPTAPCKPPLLPTSSPQWCPQAIVNHGCPAAGVLPGGRKLQAGAGSLKTAAEIEEAYAARGLGYFPIPGRTQNQDDELFGATGRSLTQFDTSQWCIPGLDCGAGNAILGDLNCDGEFEVCLLCPPGTVPYDSDDDQCEDSCVCCDAIIVNPEPTGACCTCDGCEKITQKECNAKQGIYNGDFTNCDDFEGLCKELSQGTPLQCGACCTCDGCMETSAFNCDEQNGFFSIGQQCNDETEEKCKEFLSTFPCDETIACCTCEGCFDMPFADCMAMKGQPGPPGSSCANGGAEKCKELQATGELECFVPPPPEMQGNVTCKVWGDPHLEPFPPAPNSLCNDVGGPYDILTTPWFSVQTHNALWGAGPATVMTDIFIAFPGFGIIHHDRCGAGFGGISGSLPALPGWTINKVVLSGSSTRYEVTLPSGLSFCITISRFGGLCTPSGWLQIVIDAPTSLPMGGWTGYCVGDCGLPGKVDDIFVPDGCDLSVEDARKICDPLNEVSTALFDACVLDVLTNCDLGAAIGSFDVAGLTGACCVENDVTGAPAPQPCVVTSQFACEQWFMGKYNGDGTTCLDSIVECPNDPTGACCTCNGCFDLTQSECKEIGGSFGDGSCEDPDIAEECKLQVMDNPDCRTSCTGWGDPHFVTFPETGFGDLTCNDLGWVTVLKTVRYNITAFNVPFGSTPFSIMDVVKVEFFFPALVFVFKTDGTGFGGVNGVVGSVSKAVLGPFHTQLEQMLHEIRVYRWVTGSGIPYLNVNIEMPTLNPWDLSALSGICVEGCPTSETDDWLTTPTDDCDLPYDVAEQVCSPLLQFSPVLHAQCINDVLAACDPSASIPALSAIPGTSWGACCYEHVDSTGASVEACFVGPAIQCELAGGSYAGDGVICEDHKCPEGEVGACCTCDGCLQTTEVQCNILDGAFSPNTPCVDADGTEFCDKFSEEELGCFPEGACCTCDECVQVTAPDCEKLQGIFAANQPCVDATGFEICSQVPLDELDCPPPPLPPPPPKTDLFECVVWGDPHVEGFDGSSLTCNDVGWVMILKTNLYEVRGLGALFYSGPYTILEEIIVEIYSPALVFHFKSNGFGFGGVDLVVQTLSKLVLGPFNTEFQKAGHSVRVYRQTTGAGIHYLNAVIKTPATANLNSFEGYCVDGCPDPTPVELVASPMAPNNPNKNCDNLSLIQATQACQPTMTNKNIFAKCMNDVSVACDVSAAIPAIGALTSGPVGACCYDDEPCTILSEVACNNLDGVYGGDGSTCFETAAISEELGLKFCPAEETGACCTCDGCLNLSEEECMSVGGTFTDHASCDLEEAFAQCAQAFVEKLDCECPSEAYSGDGTGNGQVDVLDVVLGVNIIKSGNDDVVSCELVALNINGDDSLDVIDLVALVNVIKSGGGK